MFDISPGVQISTPMSLDISTKHLPGLIDLVSMPNLEIDHNDRCNVNRLGGASRAAHLIMDCIVANKILNRFFQRVEKKGYPANLMGESVLRFSSTNEFWSVFS